jgi:hypothetical protein
MTQQHLSDADIQQWVLDKQQCAPEIITHMNICEHCQVKAETYQLLFSEIKQQPKPVFNFDVSELVLPQLSHQSLESSGSRFLYYLIACFAVAAIGVSAYLYRIQLNRLFKKYVLDISSGVSKGALYLLITTALTILIFQSIELYKKYQRKINDLNFY